jgi:hypothetical protein
MKKHGSGNRAPFVPCRHDTPQSSYKDVLMHVPEEPEGLRW